MGCDMYQDDIINSLYKKYKKKHENNNLAHGRTLMCYNLITFEEYSKNYMKANKLAPLGDGKAQGEYSHQRVA